MSTSIDYDQISGAIDSNTLSLENYLTNRHTLNVKDFGAVGDGVTDDSGAIQAAINASNQTGGAVGIVDFPYQGGEVYAIGATIDVTNTRTYLRGLSNPDKRTAAGAEASQLLWIGVAGGTMMTVTNPLDLKMENISLNGDDVADYGMVQSNANGGQGGCLYDNFVIEKCNKNLLTFSGAVDGGRNRFTQCAFRKTNAGTASEIDDAIIKYLDSDNVIDRFIECEMIHASTGNPEPGSVCFYVSEGSPDIYLEDCFTKAETSLVQSNDGPGIAYWSVINHYAEGENFFRSDKSGIQRQDFVNVRHVGTGGNSIEALGNTNGAPMNCINCDFAGDIVITSRDDFPLILSGTNYNAISLDTTAGTFTNLLQIGRTEGANNKPSAMINAQGVCLAMPTADTDSNLNVSLQNGGVFRSERSSGLALTVKNPTGASGLGLDVGREIEIWLIHTGGGGGTDVTVTWESEYKGATLPTTISNLTTNIFKFRYDGTNWYQICEPILGIL